MAGAGGWFGWNVCASAEKHLGSIHVRRSVGSVLALLTARVESLCSQGSCDKLW